MKLKNLTLFFVLVFSALNGNANVRVVPTSDLVALDRHIKATELVTHILTTYHYKKTELNDELLFYKPPVCGRPFIQSSKSFKHK